MENPAGPMKLNPWKMATVGIAAVITTALVTGLVVANWTGTAGIVMETSQPSTVISGGTAQDETGVRSNRAVSRRNGTTDVLEKAVIGGAPDSGVGAGGGSRPGAEAAIGGSVGATAGTLSPLQNK